ncbi:MAG: hypothetical protein ACJARO_000603 [Bacteriovoracaceae bacterium]|jgi:hypothetical protein
MDTNIYLTGSYELILADCHGIQSPRGELQAGLFRL